MDSENHTYERGIRLSAADSFIDYILRIIERERESYEKKKSVVIKANEVSLDYCVASLNGLLKKNGLNNIEVKKFDGDKDFDFDGDEFYMGYIKKIKDY